MSIRDSSEYVNSTCLLLFYCFWLYNPKGTQFIWQVPEVLTSSLPIEVSIRACITLIRRYTKFYCISRLDNFANTRLLWLWLQDGYQFPPHKPNLPLCQPIHTTTPPNDPPWLDLSSKVEMIIEYQMTTLMFGFHELIRPIGQRVLNLQDQTPSPARQRHPMSSKHTPKSPTVPSLRTISPLASRARTAKTHPLPMQKIARCIVWRTPLNTRTSLEAQ